MRRKTARPFGPSISAMRLASMLMALVVLWALYSRLKDPATWQMFVDEKGSTLTAQSAIATEPESEQLVLGPNDQDETEVGAIQDQFGIVTDRTPLKTREMRAYWRLMDWSRTQSFAELEQRAKDDVPFTQLWEQPEHYRGKLIRLRLHVRRVLQYETPESPNGVAKVCEAWGWTDESRSFPYVVVFPEPPNGLPIGTDIRTEIVFVGYFLKIMTYTAFDNPRGAPLLIGRVRLVSSAPATAPAASDAWVIPLVAAGVVLVIGLFVWMANRSRGKSKLTMLPSELSTLTAADEPTFDNPFSQIDADQRLPETNLSATLSVTSTEKPPPSA